MPASSDAKVARGIELDANGIPTAASYNLTTPVPINGTFFPKVAIGDGGRFAVSFITDYTSAWLERFQGAAGGGGTPPPAPPPAAAPLAVTGLPASVTLPTTEGTAITWTAMTSGGTAPIQYQFMRYTDGVGWSVAQAYSSNNTYTWFPSAGTHALQVWVRSSGSTAAYDAYLGTDMFTVLPPAAKVMSLSSSMASPVPLNVPLTFTATASGGSVQYKFLMYTAANGWTVGQEYSGTKSFTWYPPVGLNAVQVWVRTAGSSAAYQDWKSSGMFNVAVAPVKLSGLVSNVPNPAPPSITQTWTAYASGGPGALEYKFLRYDVGADTWSILRDWSSNNQASWTPGTANSGWHSLQVWVRSVGSSVAWEDWRSSDYFLVTASGALTLTPNRSLNGMRVGDLVTFTATVIGGTGPWEYKFLTFDGTTWKLLQGYSSQNTFSWFPPAGTCAVQVWIRAVGSHAYWERFQSTGYFVVNP